MKDKNIIIILLIVLVTVTGITATIFLFENASSKTSQSDSDTYHVPVHVYEIWDSTAIIMHGNVDKQDKMSPVSIKIKDKEGQIIESAEVIPDEEGRFFYGTSKFAPEGFDMKQIWNKTESYDVFATYKYFPTIANTLKIDAFDNLPLQKDKPPFTSEQIATMSHQQVIDTIGRWNNIGGDSPFSVISIIGLDENYQLGQPMPFFIQKSGYGNPCHDQGVMIFDEQTEENVGVNFYFGFCDPDEKDMMAFDYLIPYNIDGFPKLKPITKPGQYVVVASTSDISSKVKQGFSVENSDFVYDYKIKYTLQKESPENAKTMEIDLNSGNITVKNNGDDVAANTSLDSDTLNRLTSYIDNNDIATNPLNSMGYGEFCSTCSFGHIRLYVGDTMVNQVLWDDSKPDLETVQFRMPNKDSSTYFRLVDCIATKNGIERLWIGDEDLPSGEYKESQMSCDELIKPDQTQESIKPYSQIDYDFWVNDKPMRPITPKGSGSLGSVHEHASLLVKIFDDKFDFSKPDYQIKSPWIHFEGNDGNTIHKHSTGITLGYMFDSIGIGLDGQCYTFSDGREFCSNDEFSLKFYINGIQVDSITHYVVSQGDRILISYGLEKEKEIKEQLAELELQEILS